MSLTQEYEILKREYKAINKQQEEFKCCVVAS